MSEVPADNELLLEQYFDCLARRDRAGLVAILSPDIIVRYFAPQGLLPWGGTYEGIQGFDAFVDSVAAHVDIVKVQRTHTISGDDKVIVLSEGEWKCRHSGRRVKANMVNVFTINDGRISGYDVYNDTAAFALGIGALAIT